MTDRLARRYRRLLFAYPRAYRRSRAPHDVGTSVRIPVTIGRRASGCTLPCLASRIGCLP
jgi:hypothetical protein